MKFILFVVLFESYLGLGRLEVADPLNTSLNLYGSAHNDYEVNTLDRPEELVSSSYYDISKNLTVFLPDYSIVQRCNTTFVIEDSYIENGGVNFILVAYAPKTTDEADVKDIDVDGLSRLFANFFVKLSSLIDFTGIHVVCLAKGCELTAHIAEMIHNNDELEFTRVSLLDPPYNSVKLVSSIQKNSLFSDAIHTDGKRYGTLWSVAVADFFPNTGILQPTCLHGRANKDTCNKGSIDTCSQRNSFALWSESVANMGPPYFCADKPIGFFDMESVKMGLQCPLSARGRYYLATNIETPFAMGGNC